MEKHTSLPIYAVQGLSYILASGFGLLASGNKLSSIIFAISIISALFYLCRLAGESNLKFPDPNEKFCNFFSSVSLYLIISGYILLIILKLVNKL